MPSFHPPRDQSPGPDSGEAAATKVDYSHQRREEIVAFVPGSALEVLDVGCAAGGFGRALMAARPSILVDGIEIDPKWAAEAALAYRAVVTGAFPEHSPPGTYDAIVCNDVLEHMVDPWSAVRALRSYLNPGGVVVASLPNARCWSVLRPLLVSGRWDYRDQGVLDSTHLRWFTRATMVELFTDAGYEVKSVDRITGLPCSLKWRITRCFARTFVDDVLTSQYVVVAG